MNTTTKNTAVENFEKAWSKGDFERELMELARMTAYSVLKKVIDPQGGKAGTLDKVSDTACNSIFTDMRISVAKDTANLENISRLADKLHKLAYNKDGDLVTVVDKEVERDLDRLLSDTLGDGLDLVNTAVVAILEQAAEHSTKKSGWMIKPYVKRELKKKVYIKRPDSLAYTDVETTPIKEVFKAVRREIANSRAISIDPRNGYTYIDDLVQGENGLEEIYIRTGKYADIGGYTIDGLSGAGVSLYNDTQSIIAMLGLTDRQLEVVNLRMRGYGKKAIATYLRVNPDTIRDILKGVQKKAEKHGFTPSMYAEMCKNN